MATMKQLVRGIYRHYKGAQYRVTAVATHTETHKEYVVYHGTDGRTWVRPLGAFTENVQTRRHQFVPRFQLIRKDGNGNGNGN